jgi:rhodanese-related sulfurtransferase
MAQFIEFLMNHWILSGLWLGLSVTFILYLQAKAGSALSPQQATLLVNRQDGVILDIRDSKAFENGHIVDAINIPLAKLKERLKELEKFRDKPLVVVCQLGQQSGDAVKLLEENGFSAVYRMRGGMAEWQTQGLPAIK